MNLFPAIDLLGGRVVRLRQGDYDDTTFYGDDPVAAAVRFVDEGAVWVHMVDLDAARSGVGTNRPVMAAVAAALAGRARLQVGGGVRSADDARELVAAGVSRVVMGSAAVENPALVDEVSRHVEVAVGLDHRDGTVATHGWTQSSGVMLTDMLGRFPSAVAFVITDISRDGMLAGPDTEGLAAAARVSPAPVIASGGVGSLDDLRALAAVPALAGVIVGKALYENRFTVSDAIGALS